MIKQSFKMNFQVTSNDVGPTRTIRPSAVMKYIQEVAVVHLRDSGLSFETMKDGGIVFLIVKIGVKIYRSLACGEDFTAETWFEKLEGVKFIRNIKFTDSVGKTVVEAKSLWVAANPETHRIIRPSDYPYELPKDSERSISFDFARISVDKNIVSMASREVYWSDIDYNYHLNNTVYAEFICDFYPGKTGEGLGCNDITSFQIDFEGEAKLGDKIEIKTEMKENGCCFEGTIDSKRCFKAFVRC